MSAAQVFAHPPIKNLEALSSSRLDLWGLLLALKSHLVALCGGDLALAFGLEKVSWPLLLG